MPFIPLDQSPTSQPPRGFIPLGGGLKGVGNTDTPESNLQRGFHPLQASETEKTGVLEDVARSAGSAVVGGGRKILDTWDRIAGGMAALAGDDKSAEISRKNIEDRNSSDILNDVSNYSPKTFTGEVMHGVTGMVPSLLTSAPETMQNRLDQGKSVPDALAHGSVDLAKNIALGYVLGNVAPVGAGVTRVLGGVAGEATTTVPTIARTIAAGGVDMATFGASARAIDKGVAALDGEDASRLPNVFDPKAAALDAVLGGVFHGADPVASRISGRTNVPHISDRPSAGFTPLDSMENAVRPAARGAEGANDLGGMPNSGPTPEGYPKGRALMLAGQMTREGTPSEIYPHPYGDGSFAVRPIETNRPTETLEAPVDTSAMLSPDQIRGTEPSDPRSRENSRRAAQDSADVLSEAIRPDESLAQTGTPAAGQEPSYLQRRDRATSRMGETIGDRPTIAAVDRLAQSGLVPTQAIDPTHGPISAIAYAGIKSGAIEWPAAPEALKASEPVHNALAPGDAYTGFVRDVSQPNAAESPMSTLR